VAPIATRVPSGDIDIDTPELSSASSPSMSPPIWVHVPPLSEYTRTWPRLASFSVAPMATRVPSADIDTVRPAASPAASPSMSPPTWVHVPPLSEYTRTWPRLASFSVAPMATRVPSADIDTVRPAASPAASPSMSPPIWVHVPPLSEYTRTWPRLASFSVAVPSFHEAPMATRVPSEDIDTDTPDQSPAASPSMSPPTWVHVPPLSEYTRT
jgi:hypothetical protein